MCAFERSEKGMKFFMKAISKIIAILLIAISTLVIMPTNFSFAANNTAADAINGLSATGNVDVGGLQKVIGTLLNFLQIASGLVAVLMIAIVGFNYILATSSDMKKEMKEKALPIIIGIVLVFGATSIAKFFIGVAA